MRRGQLYTIATLFVAAIIIVAAVMVSSRPNGDGGDDAATIAVTDMLGRNVKVVDSVDRVVCVNAAALRFVCYMNGADRIVGIEEHEHGSSASDLGGRTYRIAHPEFGDLPVIGPIHGGDKELIAAVQPQIIFKCVNQASDCDNLQNDLGVPVVALSNAADLGSNYDLFCRQLRLIGQVLDEQNRAEALIDSIDGIKSDLRNRMSSIPLEQRVATYVGGISYAGSHGIDWTSSVYPPFDLVGTNNVITRPMIMNNSVGQISIEKLSQLNPDVIFIDWGEMSLCKEDYGKFKAVLDEIAALKNGKVYGVLQYNWYATNWDSLLADCYWVGKVLYPSAFADVDPAKKADEIYRTWVGAPIFDEVVANCGGGFQEVDLGS